MGMGVGEQVRKIELDAYQAFMKVTAVTGMSWVRLFAGARTPRDLDPRGAESPTPVRAPSFSTPWSPSPPDPGAHPHPAPPTPPSSITPTDALDLKKIPHLRRKKERDELATKLRAELSISNDDHTRIREKLSEDERVKNMREGYRQRELAQAAKKARVDAGPSAPPKAKAAPKAKTPKPTAKTAKGPNGAPLVVNELICRRVQRFWPDEGGWFDAIVTDYRPTTNEHCLTYEINTPNETFEWANVSSFDAREFKLVEGEPVNIADLKFFSQGITPGAETASHNQTVATTHAAVGGIDTLVKKVARTADPTKVAEAKGTLSAQEEALRAKLAALESDSDSDEE
jgi:hypothetical protein